MTHLRDKSRVKSDTKIGYFHTVTLQNIFLEGSAIFPVQNPRYQLFIEPTLSNCWCYCQHVNVGLLTLIQDCSNNRVSTGDFYRCWPYNYATTMVSEYWGQNWTNTCSLTITQPSPLSIILVSIM